jgi:hypothetical protein
MVLRLRREIIGRGALRRSFELLIAMPRSYPWLALNKRRIHVIQEQLTTQPWFRTDKRRVARGSGAGLKEVEVECSPNSLAHLSQLDSEGILSQ